MSRKRPLWTGLWGLALVVPGIALAAEAPPPAPPDTRITVEGSDGPATVLAAIDAAGPRLADAAGRADTGGRAELMVWYDLATGARLSQGGEAASASGLDDDPYLVAIRTAVDAYRALGGEAPDRPLVLERGEQGFFAGFDGEGGRWFASAAEAQGQILRQLVLMSRQLPTAVRTAVAEAKETGSADAVLAAAREGAAKVVYLRRGAKVVIDLPRPPGSGEGTEIGSFPFALSPDGLVIGTIDPSRPGRLRVSLTVPDDAETGTHRLNLYDPGHAFMAAAGYDLSVVGGSEADSSSASSSSYNNGAPIRARTPTQLGAFNAAVAGVAPVQPLSTSGGVPGVIAAPGAEASYRIDLTGPATVAIQSSGPTDLVGRLETTTGLPIASNDDSGNWYNFQIQQSLPAGSYVLKVGHCCAGTGAFAIHTTITPQ